MRRAAFPGLALLLALAAPGARAEEDLTACYQGSAAQTAGEPALAVSHYNRCIEWGELTAPTLATVLTNRATARQALGDYAAALRDYTEALRVDPEKASAYNGRCWVLALMRRPERALANCNESLRLAPDDPYTLDSRALVYWLLGELDKARADLEHARELDPTFPSWQDRFDAFAALY